MIESNDLSKLEACCEAFYCGSYEAQRTAHGLLLPLVSDSSCLPQLQLLLANSQKPNTLIFAASSLLKLITGSWNRISESQKDDTRKFVLNYLFTHGPQLLLDVPLLLQYLVRLLCRVVKLGWIERLQNQNITEQVRHFLQSSTSHWIVGLTICTFLTEDMQPVSGNNLARFRRTAASFKDTALMEIFDMAMQTLQQLESGAVHFSNATEEPLLFKQVLQLTLNCLAFDFTGNPADEAADEQSVLSIPSGWSSLIGEKTPAMFFNIYNKCWTGMRPPRVDCARLCLQCLVLLASIRKAFFPKEEERRVFVSQLIYGTSSIVQTQLGLLDNQCLHELCRLLGKINASNHLYELCKTDGFQVWLNRVFKFTISNLENWKQAPNSTHYLVGLWTNLVVPFLYMKNGRPDEILLCIRKVTMAYIDSRIKMAEAIADAADQGVDLDIDDNLSNEVIRGEQLDVIHNLSRCSYSEVANRIISLFNETQKSMRDGACSVRKFHHKMSWITYMIATLLNVSWIGRGPRLLLLNGTSCIERRHDDEHDGSNSNSSSDDDNRVQILVGEMATLVFGLIGETDKLDSNYERLELAYLYFLEQFKEVYVGERTKQTTQSQIDLKFLSLGTSDVLNLLVGKLFFNLQRRIRDVAVIKRTLQLLHHSVTGICVVHEADRLPRFVVSGKLLLQSQLVVDAIADHQNPKFAFLSIPQYGKFRTSFYSTVTRLFMMETKDDDKFQEFMKPFKASFDSLAFSVAQGGLKTEANCVLVKQLARDLRGVVMSCTSTEAYNQVFNWLVDNPRQQGASRIDIFCSAADAWLSDHSLMVPTLRFMAELVHNKSQRITFDQNSPNGILLFKIVSNLLSSYGQRILTTSDIRDVYRQKYKGIACTLEMLSYVLNGGYTNFGVFEVYNDPVLGNSLALGLQLSLAIPNQDLQAYIHALKSFYLFVELATQCFMSHVIQLPSQSLAQLLTCLEDGLCSFESGICMQSCSSVDSIVQYIYTKKASSDDEGRAVRSFLTEQPQSLSRILQLMFQLVIMGEVTGTWSLARPLLGLLLLQHEEFVQIKEQLIRQQTPERQAKIEGTFRDLMTDVEENLSAKNKEVFVKNLFAFSTAMRTYFP